MLNTYFEKFLKSPIKLIRSPCPVMLQTVFIRKALQGHSKGTPRALEGHLGTWAYRYFGTRGLKGHLGTCVFKALDALEALYLADSHGKLCNLYWILYCKNGKLWNPKNFKHTEVELNILFY